VSTDLGLGKDKGAI